MSGYTAKFIYDLQPRHKCTICGLAMRNPVQTGCGHLFCKKCLEPKLQLPNPKCPVDQESISKMETFPDNACKREILSLSVQCNNSLSGCKWTGILKNLESHLEVCDYRQARCTECGARINFSDRRIHVTAECPKRLVICEYCQAKVPLDCLEAHTKSSCPSYLHSCPNQCSKRRFKLQELSKHLEVVGGDCPLQRIPCPYYDLGCSVQLPREDMDGHLDEVKVFHSQLLVDSVVTIKSAIPQLSQDVKCVEEGLESLRLELASVDQLNVKIDEKCDFIENKQEKLFQRLEAQLKEQIVKLQIEQESLQRQLKSSSSPHASLSSPYLPPAYTAASSSVPDSMALAYNSTISQRVDHLFAKVGDLDQTVTTCLNRNLDCDVRLQLLERATYDGRFLWKIDNYALRRKEAINGTTLSLYSSPFYTSKQGYKMCARVYLNGDGSGKNTHISFFFCMMRGPFDALLPWPFQQKVTLLLINQDGMRNVIDQFRPDTMSSSFQRPIHREMNIASGCPTFCPLSELHNGFVKEDSIFLGIIVDTTNIPQPVSVIK